MPLLHEALNRRPAPRPGPRPHGWLADAAFVAEAGRILDALSRMHLAASIYILRFDGLSPSRACALAEDALSGEGLVGRLPGRSVGLLRIAGKSAAPDALRAQLAGRLGARLAQLEPSAKDVRVHIAERHGWTDRHESAVEIVEELMEEPGIAYPLGRRWPS